MKKFVSLLSVGIMSAGILAGCGSSETTTEATDDTGSDTTEATETADVEDIDLGVLVWKFDDTYGSTVRSAMEKYAEEETDVNVNLNMQDAQNDQAKQNDQLDILIQKGVDLLVINAVDTGSAQGLADKANAAGLPAVFYNKEPDQSVIQSVEQGAIFIGTQPEQAGIMQGDILADMWEEHPEYDTNGDGVVQYVVFKGEVGNPEAEARAEYCVKEAEERGLTMEDVYGEPVVANWATDQAQQQMQAILSANSGEIEAVFCGNDDMALGVLAALNADGYNTGEEGDPWIPVIGVDGTDAAIEAINQGRMAGTVTQDGDTMGKAIIECSVNKVLGNDFLDGTEFEYAEDGTSIRIPYTPYVAGN